MVSAIKRAIEQHTIEIDLTGEATGTGSNPVDLTSDTSQGKDLIDLTPEKQSTSNRHTANMDVDGDQHDHIEVEETNKAGIVSMDRDSESDAEVAHESFSGSEASSSHSSIYNRLTSCSSHDSEMEAETTYYYDTDDEVTDCMRDDDGDEQDQQEHGDESDRNNDYNERGSPNLGESEPAKKHLPDDHDMSDTDGSISKGDDSSESEGYSSSDDVLNGGKLNQVPVLQIVR